MTAQDVLAELDRRGVSTRVAGGRLHLAPAAALDAELLAEARRLKRDLLRLLAPGISTPAECGWCGAALAPYLPDVAERPALLCLVCRRWTYTGGGAS